MIIIFEFITTIVLINSVAGNLQGKEKRHPSRKAMGASVRRVMSSLVFWSAEVRDEVTPGLDAVGVRYLVQFADLTDPNPRINASVPWAVPVDEDRQVLARGEGCDCRIRRGGLKRYLRARMLSRGNDEGCDQHQRHNNGGRERSD